MCDQNNSSEVLKPFQPYQTSFHHSSEQQQEAASVTERSCSYHPEFHETRWDYLHEGQRSDQANRYLEQHTVQETSVDQMEQQRKSPLPPQPQEIHQPTEGHSEIVPETNWSEIRFNPPTTNVTFPQSGENEKPSYTPQDNAEMEHTAVSAVSNPVTWYSEPQHTHSNPDSVCLTCNKCCQEMASIDAGSDLVVSQSQEKEIPVKKSYTKRKKLEKLVAKRMKFSRSPERADQPATDKMIMKKDTDWTIPNSGWMRTTYDCIPSVSNSHHSIRRQKSFSGVQNLNEGRLHTAQIRANLGAKRQLFVKHELIEALDLASIRSQSKTYRSSGLPSLVQSKPMTEKSFGADRIIMQSREFGYHDSRDQVTSQSSYNGPAKRSQWGVHTIQSHDEAYATQLTGVMLAKPKWRTIAELRRYREKLKERGFDKHVAEAKWEKKEDIDAMRKILESVPPKKLSPLDQHSSRTANALCARHEKLETERMYAWEQGHIDYTGSDRFANILAKLCDTLTKAGDTNLPVESDPSNREHSVVESESRLIERKNIG